MNNRDSSITVPALWSFNAAKRRRYAQESYFQEVFHELCQISVHNGFSWVHNKAFILFKPDASAARCVEKCMKELSRAYIRPIGSSLLTFTRHIFRELWRYELNRATYERFDAVDTLLCSGPTLLVLLERDPVANETRSLSEVLNLMKGPSTRKLRKPHHLRALIGASEGTLNLIHTPDETADVVRELGVLLDRLERAPILPMLTKQGNPPHDIQDHLSIFYASTAPHHLDSCRVIDGWREQRNDLNYDHLLDWAATQTCFDDFCRTIASAGIAFSHWDALVVYLLRRPFTVNGVLPLLEFEHGLPGYPNA